MCGSTNTRARFDFTFDGSRYLGAQVELYKQIGGNMPTTRSSPEEF
jgi:hypothetical protein